MRATAAKNDGADWNAIWIFPIRINGWALPGGSREARVGVRSFGASGLADFRSPAVSFPVDTLVWRLLRHAFPPHSALGSKRDIGEDAVGRQCRHCVGIGPFGRAGSDAKESSLRIDGPQLSVGVRNDPSDVIANGCHF